MTPGVTSFAVRQVLLNQLSVQKGWPRPRSAAKAQGKRSWLGLGGTCCVGTGAHSDCVHNRCRCEHVMVPTQCPPPYSVLGTTLKIGIFVFCVLQMRDLGPKVLRGLSEMDRGVLGAGLRVWTPPPPLLGPR